MKPDVDHFELQAELCLALGHATRLRMIHLLKAGPQRVNQIAERLQINQPTASRHLTVLRNAGILAAHRHGTDMLYQIANPKIVEVCNMMRAVLTKRESQRSEILRDMQAVGPEGSPYAV
jgi:DNA-binding transcriptional ArsR family regulator